MGKAEFEASLASGAHAALARMAGQWEGRTQVWFDPDQPAGMDVPQRATFRSVLGGRFLLHEYAYGAGDEAGEGMALYGVHLDGEACQSAWVDTFHTGTAHARRTAPVIRSWHTTAMARAARTGVGAPSCRSRRTTRC